MSRRPLAPLVLIAAFGVFLWTAHRLRDTHGDDDLLLAADTRRGARAMAELKCEGITQKHLAFSPVASTVVSVLRRLPGLDTGGAIIGTVALIAALDVLLAFLVLSRLTGDAGRGLAWTAVYGSAYASLVYLSIPDTYALTQVPLLGFFLLAHRWRDQVTARRSMILGAVAGVGALFNPPLLGLLAPVAYWTWRRGLAGPAAARGAFAVAVGLLVFAGAYTAAFGPRFYEHFLGLRNLYAHGRHYWDPEAWASVLLGFFGFSMISPFDGRPAPDSMVTPADAARYATSLVPAIAVVLWAAVLARTVHWLGRVRDSYSLGVLLWLGILIPFYVYFEPREALLFAPQVVGPLIFLGAGAMESLTPRLRALVPLALALVLAVWNGRLFLA